MITTLLLLTFAQSDFPHTIPAPRGMEKSPGPWNDPKDPTLWPNQTSRSNSDPWLAVNHDKLRQMKPRVLLINFSNEHSREHLDRLAERLIVNLAESSRWHGYKNPKAP